MIKAERKTENIVGLIIGIALCCVLAILVTHPSKLDQFVLLEQRNPGFYDLSQGNVYSTNDIDSQNLIRLNFLFDDYFGRPEYEGLTETFNADGSITINGCNEDNAIALPISVGNYLPNGKYYYSTITNQQLGVTFYTEAWDERNGETIKDQQAVLPDNNAIIIDSGKYQYYWVGMYIPKGTEFKNYTIYPMICRINGLEYQSTLIKGIGLKDKLYVVELDANSTVTSDDIAKLSNYLKYQYPECKYMEIEIKDTDGVKSMIVKPENIDKILAFI